MSALVASLLAVGSAPAGAAEIKAGDANKAEPSYTTKASACVGPARADHMFSDVSNLNAHRDAINCLAHYRITVGKGDGTFAPGENVRASQMKAFMTQAAKVASVDPAKVLDGVMMSDPVTRADMAVLITNLLVASPHNMVKRGTDGKVTINNMPSDTFDHFADVRLSQPRYRDEAISTLYELGIVAGTSATAYSPGANVSRGQMATIITNALAHTNARPSGLTAQVNNTNVTVSMRDADFKPVVNAMIDAFKADVAHESRAFKDDGTCSSRVTPAEADVTTGKCEIDTADPVTLSDGNVTFSVGNVGEGKTVWIWTGTTGDKLGPNTDRLEISVPKGAADPVTAARAVVSTDLPKDPNAATPTDVERVRFGTTVTVTIQLKGAAGGDDADKDAKPAEDATIKYTVVKSTRSVTVGSDGTATVSDTAISQDTETVTIDSNGKGTFTLIAADPDSRPGMSNILAVRYAIDIPQTDGTNNDHALGITSGQETDDIIFTDASAAVSYVAIENPSAQVAPGANRNAGAVVIIKVLDQYGSPFNGARVFMHSSNPNTGTGDTDGGASIGTRARSTSSGGTTRFPYTYTGGASEETLRASWDGAVDLNGDGDTDDTGESGEIGVEADVSSDCQTEDKCGSTTVLWVFASTEVTASDAPVLSLDAENSQIVVDGGTDEPNSVNYDSNDFFFVINAANADPGKPMSMEDFVAALTKELAAAKATSDDDQPTLTWRGYVHDDPTGSITSFTMTTGGSPQR